MMDLLVQITTAHKLSPGSHAVHAIGDRGVLPYKPSTPIGNNIYHVRLYNYMCFSNNLPVHTQYCKIIEKINIYKNKKIIVGIFCLLRTNFCGGAPLTHR